VTTAAPDRASASRVDFERDVYCIGGLPIDAVGMAEAVRRVRDAAFSGMRCTVATPNLNFVQLAARDAAFRASVCRSQLVLADGMPIVWMARLLGAPIDERVSGAGLFEALWRHPGPPLKVYFYGGPPGAAEAAHRAVNTRGGGLVSVGHESPPFVDDARALDSDSSVARINASGAQFVIVSLGAQKGQAWIDRHADRLAAPVLSHLGAVVNFAAGTVRRAPQAWQRAGLEWLWRIREEPALWRRYWRDGWRFVRFAALEMRPVRRSVHRRSRRADRGAAVAAEAPKLDVQRSPGRVDLVCAGAWSAADLGPVRVELRRAVEEGSEVRLTLRDIERADSAFVGLLVLAHGALAGRFSVVEAPSELRRTLRACGALYLLTGP